jgi:hypothetical protein
MRTPPGVSHRRRLICRFVFTTSGNISKPITAETTYTLSCITQSGSTLTKSDGSQVCVTGVQK